MRKIIRSIFCWFGLHKTTESEWVEIIDENADEIYDSILHEVNTCIRCGKSVERFNITK